MLGLSGLETLMQLKDIAPNLPVVMVTKNEEEDIMDRASSAPKIADYLIKPVNPKQILLTLKKNIHQREIVQEVTQTGYRQDFGRIGMQLSEQLTPDEWKELYRRLVHWELELASTGSAMDDLLRMQKEEANATFAKLIKRHYEHWVQHPDERPLMSPDLFKRCIFPRSQPAARCSCSCSTTCATTNGAPYRVSWPTTSTSTTTFITPYCPQPHSMRAMPYLPDSCRCK